MLQWKGGGERRRKMTIVYIWLHCMSRLFPSPCSLLRGKHLVYNTALQRTEWLKMGQMIYGVGGGAENKLVASFRGDKMRNKGTFKNVVETNRTRAKSVFFRRAASLWISKTLDTWATKPDSLFQIRNRIILHTIQPPSQAGISKSSAATLHAAESYFGRLPRIPLSVPARPSI